MNMQTTILLDPFTAQNGATAIRPGKYNDIIWVLRVRYESSD